jgi:hypothetical protein
VVESINSHFCRSLPLQHSHVLALDCTDVSNVNRQVTRLVCRTWSLLLVTITHIRFFPTYNGGHEIHTHFFAYIGDSVRSGMAFLRDAYKPHIMRCLWLRSWQSVGLLLLDKTRLPFTSGMWGSMLFSNQVPEFCYWWRCLFAIYDDSVS